MSFFPHRWQRYPKSCTCNGPRLPIVGVMQCGSRNCSSSDLAWAAGHCPSPAMGGRCWFRSACAGSWTGGGAAMPRYGRREGVPDSRRRGPRRGAGELEPRRARASRPAAQREAKRHAPSAAPSNAARDGVAIAGKAKGACPRHRGGAEEGAQKREQELSQLAEARRMENKRLCGGTRRDATHHRAAERFAPWPLSRPRSTRRLPRKPRSRFRSGPGRSTSPKQSPTTSRAAEVSDKRPATCDRPLKTATIANPTPGARRMGVVSLCLRIKGWEEEA